MQSGVSVVPAVVGILMLVILGLMLVASVVGTILFFAGKRGSGVRRVGGSLAMVCSSTLGLLMVAGFVASLLLTSARQSQEQHVRVQKVAELKRLGEELHRQSGEADQIELKPEQPVIIRSNVDAGLQRFPEDAASPSATEAANSGAGSVPSTTAAQPVQRPAWTNIPMSVSGDVTHIILISKQYSTAEEARLEVAAAALKLLVDDFEKIYGVSAENLKYLPVDTLKTTAVKQEHVETVDRDFGNFTAPMHRVWWQVELSPIVRTTLHPLWKSGVQEQRVLIVGGGLLAATVCLAGISLYSHRRRRAPVPAAVPSKAAAVVLGVGALTLLAQRCKRWWRA